ncbi:MAG: pyridoxal 5'-phosphate synthase glutaminase subunit PdxT [Chloroflexi bacterium]|nr:pyridoxal 5'-phosphate synthase glutaminase subunit PdxT [Chloroflexota bacterium]
MGVLALQGDFSEHRNSLLSLGVEVIEVRNPKDFELLDGLILPGGESTSIAKIMDYYNLRPSIKKFANDGNAIWGTCAGLILMSSQLEEDKPTPLGLLDINVRRNGFGRQADSFEADVHIAGIPNGTIHVYFIRAPQIIRTGPNVQILSTLEDGQITAVQEGNLIATSFHPELSSDPRMHSYFLKFCNRSEKIH